MLLKQKPRYCHKSKNIYLLVSACRIKINGEYRDGYIYVNENLPEEVFVREKQDFEDNFVMLD